MGSCDLLCLSPQYDQISHGQLRNCNERDRGERLSAIKPSTATIGTFLDTWTSHLLLTVRNTDWYLDGSRETALIEN